MNLAQAFYYLFAFYSCLDQVQGYRRERSRGTNFCPVSPRGPGVLGLRPTYFDTQEGIWDKYYCCKCHGVGIFNELWAEPGTDPPMFSAPFHEYSYDVRDCNSAELDIIAGQIGDPEYWSDDYWYYAGGSPPNEYNENGPPACARGIGSFSCSIDAAECPMIRAAHAAVYGDDFEVCTCEDSDCTLVTSSCEGNGIGCIGNGGCSVDTTNAHYSAWYSDRVAGSCQCLDLGYDCLLFDEYCINLGYECSFDDAGKCSLDATNTDFSDLYAQWIGDCECVDQSCYASRREECDENGQFLTSNTLYGSLEECICQECLFESDNPYVAEFQNLLSFGAVDPVCQAEAVGAEGDPHFKTWSRMMFDFHGQCDLVLMQAPEYNGGEGLDIHIRTKARYQYSYIESVAVRIGEDILEVGSFGEHFVNGVDGTRFPKPIGQSAMITYVMMNKKRHHWEISLDKTTKIVIKTFKDLVSVSVDAKDRTPFHGSLGLLGSIDGKFLGREGKTVFSKNNPNAFGQEWQVTDTESKLFQNTENFPQYPDRCLMPSDAAATEEARRRLGEEESTMISEEAAKAACVAAGRHEKDDMNACVYDVLAIGDLEVAQTGAF